MDEFVVNITGSKPVIPNNASRYRCCILIGWQFMRLVCGRKAAIFLWSFSPQASTDSSTLSSRQVSARLWIRSVVQLNGWMWFSVWSRSRTCLIKRLWKNACVRCSSSESLMVAIRGALYRGPQWKNDHSRQQAVQITLELIWTGGQ